MCAYLCMHLLAKYTRKTVLYMYGNFVKWHINLRGLINAKAYW